MVTNNHYRWDFIGLSTDEKPTPETSEKVTNGSTFYCSDNSKLYVWYKTQWYEKVIEGGGGGGTSDFNQLSNRPKNNGTTMTGDTDINSIKALSSSDYNWNDETLSTENPNCVGLWLLEDGIYYSDSLIYACSSPDAIGSKSNERGYFMVSSVTEPNPEAPYDISRNILRIANNVPIYFDYMHFKDPGYWQLTGQGALADQAIVFSTISQYLSVINEVPNETTFGPDGSIRVYLDYTAASPYPIRLFVCNGGYNDPQTAEWKYSWVEVPLFSDITPVVDTSAPTSSTAGRLGEIRIDSTDNSAYMCVVSDSLTPTYTWKKITA